MTARIEWRTKGQGEDALLFVREYGEAGDTVMKSWNADEGILRDFLNDMERLNADSSRLETDVEHRKPQQFGKLVIARAHEGGDVLNIDPEPYWDGIYYWFRKHGVDPHPWRGRES